MMEEIKYELSGIVNSTSLVSLPNRYFRVLTRDGSRVIGLTTGDLHALSALPFKWMEPGKIKHRLDCIGSLLVWTLWCDFQPNTVSLSLRGRSRLFAKDTLEIQEITELTGMTALAA